MPRPRRSFTPEYRVEAAHRVIVRGGGATPTRSSDRRPHLSGEVACVPLTDALDAYRREQQHQGAVHGEQLVVLLVRQKLQPRSGQLGADERAISPPTKKKVKQATTYMSPISL